MVDAAARMGGGVVAGQHGRGHEGVVFQVENVKQYGDMEVVERTAELIWTMGTQYSGAAGS